MDYTNQLQWSHGLRHVLFSAIDYWDYCFESQSKHERSPVYSVFMLFCVVTGLATDWSLIKTALPNVVCIQNPGISRRNKSFNNCIKFNLGFNLKTSWSIIQSCPKLTWLLIEQLCIRITYPSFHSFHSFTKGKQPRVGIGLVSIQWSHNRKISIKRCNL